MLRALDDTLHHQLPLTFDQVGPSDHRFYDRYWFSIFANNGEALVITTVGMYKNVNVMDGAACVVDTGEGRQYNLRVSRQLRPELDQIGAGPLRYELIEPMKRHRLLLEENELGHSFDLEVEAIAPPHEEGHYFIRKDGRVVQDYHRFDQVGRVSGWVKVGGKTYTATRDSWTSVRDHSWGLRYRYAGGFEPVTSEEEPPAQGGLFNWFTWHGADYSCYFQIRDDGDAAWHSLDGSIILLSGNESREVRLKDVQHQLEFCPGTRRIERAGYTITDEEGGRREILATRVTPLYLAPAGYGYSMGFQQGRGHGVYRGRLHTEGEVWDVSEPGIVRDLEGNVLSTPTAGATGDMPVRVEENGIVTYGHLAGSVRGTYPRYGFTG